MKWAGIGGVALAVVCAMAMAGTANATELLTNGDFETGGLNGWTPSGGNISAVHNTAPSQTALDGLNIPNNPIGQTTYALTNGFPTATYFLSQDFTTTGGDINVSFDLLLATADTSVLDDTNEGVGVGIFQGGLDFADLVEPLFGSTSSTPNDTWQDGLSFDAGALASGTYTLAFILSDNVAVNMNMGVDNVSVDEEPVTPPTDVPEPKTLALLGGGLLGLGFLLRRRRKA